MFTTRRLVLCGQRDSSGKFLPNFDPLKTEGQGFIEGNSWNYSLYVPHDVGRNDRDDGRQG